MGCGEFLVKYILFFANLAFALAGLTLLALGIAVQLRIETIIEISDVNIQIAPISCMVVGSVVFVIAFLGCCGAIREGNCMLVSYSIFLLILMIVKTTLAIVIFIYLDTILEKLPEWLKEAFENNVTGFHEIERTFNCCGPNGPQSYVSLPLPSSCCVQDPCDFDNSFNGCDVVIRYVANTYGLTIGVVSIIVVAVELVAAVFGFCLASHVRNKNRRSWY